MSKVNSFFGGGDEFCPYFSVERQIAFSTVMCYNIKIEWYNFPSHGVQLSDTRKRRNHMASNPNYCDITPEIEARAAQAGGGCSIDPGG